MGESGAVPTDFATVLQINPLNLEEKPVFIAGTRKSCPQSSYAVQETW